MDSTLDYKITSHNKINFTLIHKITNKAMSNQLLDLTLL